mmetsp:Transcript_8153/g.10650  ORF Transcript_8153/g.10650 Transcript_8153/m.10650 type:complete len:504 (-) Transcript_8153:105-1616(-)
MFHFKEISADEDDERIYEGSRQQHTFDQDSTDYSDDYDEEDPIGMHERGTTDSDGDHFSYGDEEDNTALTPVGFPALSSSMDDYEINTNDESGLYSDSGMPLTLEDADSGILYDDDGHPVEYHQNAESIKRQPSTFVRLLHHARQDLARTFSDPDYPKSPSEKDRYHLAPDMDENTNFMDDVDVHPNTSLDYTCESGTATTALEDSRMSSNDYDEDIDNVENEVYFSTEPIFFEGTPKAIPSGERKSKRKMEDKKVHFRCCGHGIFWTTLAIAAGIAGSYSSIVSHRSTDFVTLNKPILIAPIYEEVTSLGLFEMEVCTDQNATNHYACTNFELAPENLEDPIFQASRLFISLGAFFGTLVTAFLALSLFWESINLKPICIGYLLAYFLQSFTMLFFDSIICSDLGCKMGRGGTFCIGAAVCWIVACVAVTRMDNFKRRSIRRRKLADQTRRRQARKERRQQRKLAKESSYDIKTATGDDFSLEMPTQATLATSTTDSSKYEC